jgi:hypothetical protein
VFAVPDDTFAAATVGLAFDSADTVVSPVDTLSTGDEGVAVVTEAVAAESAVADAESLLAASLRAHAAAKLSTLPTRTARLSSERVGDTGSSKQRFIDMLVHSCTVP